MDAVRYVLATAKDIALVPLRTATSKKAQKAYIGVALVGFLASALLGISTLSFLVFYNVYIPKVGIERPLHLQFGQGHPFARTDFARSLVSNQQYDITISLVLPRTSSNIAAGNFMLDLALSPPSASQTDKNSLLHQVLDVTEPIIVRSRRTAILTYTSTVVGLAQTVGKLPLYVMGWGKERETVEVTMFEGVEFRRGASNIPNGALLVIEADERMQFYSATLKIHAKFHGLRWFLYNYKITSFVIFTTAFLGISLQSMLVAYLVFAFRQGGIEDKKSIKQEIKSEPREELTFDNTPRQGLESVGYGTPDDMQIKKEDFDNLTPSDMAPFGGEADDEDEEDDVYDGNTSAWRDSGIGTGREDSQNKAGRKRKSYTGL